MPFGEPQIRSIVERLGEVPDNDREATRTDYIQDLAQDISRKYTTELASYLRKSTRYVNSTGKLNATGAFVDTTNEVLSDEELPPVDLRIQQSAILALYYLYFSPELRSIVNRYADANQNKLQKLTNTQYDQTLANVEVEAIVRIIEKQQKKDGEKLLTEKFPNAPTTGFEFEQIDIIRDITSERALCDIELFILNRLPSSTNDKISLLEQFKTPETRPFASKLIKLIKGCENDATVARLIQSQLLHTISKRLKIDQILTIDADIPIFDSPEDNQEKKNKQAALKKLEREMQLTDDPDLQKIIKHQMDFVKGYITLKKGDVLTANELVAICMLVPSVAERLSEQTPIDVVPELSSAEEIITRPTQSISLSLRDFLHLIKSKAIISSRLSVHQNVAGVELTPEDSEIMEVTAILSGAEYDVKREEITDEELTDYKHYLEYGISYYTESYSKQSGKNIFPYHRSKPADMSIAYPTKKRSLVEFRSKRALDTSEDYARHVRASTFTWLACWGKQAQQKQPEERSETEKQLAEEWNTLMTNWKSLLDEKAIHQPTGEERYDELVESNGKTYITNREKYTVYLDTINLRNIEDKRSLRIADPNSTRSRSRKLITEYNKRVKEIIKAPSK